MTLAPDAIAPAIDELRRLLGDRVSTAPALLESHGRGESYHPTRPPHAVVFPHSIDEIVRVVRVCALHRSPIVPFGAGTSVEGHVGAMQGGVSLDLSQMNEILAVHAEDMDATVQAGVTRMQLNRHLRDLGLFFSVDPGADATLGGMAATRASGTNAVLYGTMRENVLGLTVVLADGRVVRTARRARKSSAGYDLTRLFVGSEGTLGVIAEVTVRLRGVPESIVSAVCSFPSVRGAVETVIDALQMGVTPARCELLDAVCIDAVNRYSGLSQTVAPSLFLEFHGDARGVEAQAAAVAEIAADRGGGEFRWSSGQEERERLWQARHDAAYALMALRPGGRAMSTDVCVPISRLAECIEATRAEVESTPFPASILGHVGDGNYHVVFIVDPERRDEIEAIESAHARMIERALSMDGTCTGEHGVGCGKVAFMRAEHGEGVEVMRAIKSSLDPLGLMNPGKVLPAPEGPERPFDTPPLGSRR